MNINEIISQLADLQLHASGMHIYFIHHHDGGHRLPPQSSEVGTDYAASWTTMDTDIGMCSVVVSVLFNLFKVSVMT